MKRFYASMSFLGFILSFFFFAGLLLAIYLGDSEEWIAILALAFLGTILTFVVGAIGKSVCEMQSELQSLRHKDAIRTIKELG